MVLAMASAAAAAALTASVDLANSILNGYGQIHLGTAAKELRTFFSLLESVHLLALSKTSAKR